WEDGYGQRSWLPIIDKRGMPCGYNYGTNWTNWSFRTNHPNLSLTRFHDQVPKWLLFWSHKNDITLADGHFNFHVKKIEMPTGWQKDFLRIQLAKPWEKFETATWVESKQEFRFDEVLHADLP
ncbi:hypothetical protein N9069_01245, partial [bacterium]|nr:hypothetical protein [bacterium]